MAPNMDLSKSVTPIGPCIDKLQHVKKIVEELTKHKEEDHVLLFEEIPSSMCEEEDKNKSLKDSSVLEEQHANMHEVFPQPMCAPIVEQVDSDGDHFWDEMEAFFSSLDLK